MNRTFERRIFFVILFYHERERRIRRSRCRKLYKRNEQNLEASYERIEKISLSGKKNTFERRVFFVVRFLFEFRFPSRDVILRRESYFFEKRIFFIISCLTMRGRDVDRDANCANRINVSETVSYGWIEGNLFAKKTFLEEETRAFDETRTREI